MDFKKLIPIIAIVSVAVMVVWGTVSKDWSNTWLAPFIGGILITIVSILGKNKDKKE